MKYDPQRLVDRDTLAELMVVAPGHIRTLTTRGLPVAGSRKSQHGKPGNLYRLGAVVQWLMEHRLYRVVYSIQDDGARYCRKMKAEMRRQKRDYARRASLGFALACYRQELREEGLS